MLSDRNQFEYNISQCAKTSLAGSQKNIILFLFKIWVEGKLKQKIYLADFTLDSFLFICRFK
jgi:hypothetical protein